MSDQMRKLFLTGLMLLSMASIAFAGSAILDPTKCQYPDNSAPIADSSIWTGVKYNGFPVLWGTDSIGYNANYIHQVVLIKNTDGTTTVQIFTSGKPTSLYTASKKDLNTGTTGISSIAFQDSGIVMPRPLYTRTLLRDMSLNCQWSIIGVFKLDAVKAQQFKNNFLAWNTTVGKLNQKSISLKYEYYWK